MTLQGESEGEIPNQDRNRKKVDFLQEIAMTKRSPDKREQKRLKKIEDERQKKRYLAAEYVSRGLSYRKAADKIGLSHQFVMYWARRLLDEERVVGDDGSDVSVFRFKEGYRELLATRKTGPQPGKCPKVDEIIGKVAAQARKPFCGVLGAAKIKVLSGVDASAPTVRKALRKAGFEIRTRKTNLHRQRFSRAYPNCQWNIDFVEIGVDSATGRKVESLSVTDDHSRMSFSSYVTVNATTDFVIEALEELMGIYGRPDVINSDHGTQWYSTTGGECRFDAWCEPMDIEHRLAPIRVPEENGKVERYHGNLRTEANLPPKASLEEYERLLTGYRDFYNDQRPHWSLDLRTPREVYDKTERFRDTVMEMILEAVFGPTPQ